MKRKQPKTESSSKKERPPFKVHLPGFIGDEEVGLGDAIKSVTSAIGIKPCGGCARRATALNRWMVISGKR